MLNNLKTKFFSEILLFLGNKFLKPPWPGCPEYFFEEMLFIKHWGYLVLWFFLVIKDRPRSRVLFFSIEKHRISSGLIKYHFRYGVFVLKKPIFGRYGHFGSIWISFMMWQKTDITLPWGIKTVFCRILIARNSYWSDWVLCPRVTLALEFYEIDIMRTR